MNNIISSTALKYGMYGGLLTIAVSLITFIMGFSPDSMAMMGIMTTLAMVIIFCGAIYLTLKDIRSQQNYLTLGQAMLGGLMTCLLIGLMSGVFNYIYYNFIDTGYLVEMQDIMAEFLEDSGMPDEIIEAQLEGIQKSDGILNISMSALFSGAIGLVISLVAGLIMKRDEDRLDALDSL